MRNLYEESVEQYIGEEYYEVPVMSAFDKTVMLKEPKVKTFSLIQGPKGINLCCSFHGSVLLIENTETLRNLKKVLDTLEVVDG